MDFGGTEWCLGLTLEHSLGIDILVQWLTELRNVLCFVLIHMRKLQTITSIRQSNRSLFKAFVMKGPQAKVQGHCIYKYKNHNNIIVRYRLGDPSNICFGRTQQLFWFYIQRLLWLYIWVMVGHRKCAAKVGIAIQAGGFAVGRAPQQTWGRVKVRSGQDGVISVTYVYWVIADGVYQRH